MTHKGKEAQQVRSKHVVAFLREAFLGQRKDMLPTGVVCRKVTNNRLTAAEPGLRLDRKCRHGGMFHLQGKALSAKQSQLPQPLLIRLLLQTLHQLRCPSLHALQYLNIPLVVGGPKLNTVFEVRPHQCQVQGHNHFPSPAGHAIFDTSQDAIGLLGRLGTLLAHIQAADNQHPQVLLCQAAFQTLFPKPVALHGVAVAQINTPAQLGVICKLTEGTLNPLVQIIDKDIKQDWPQHRPLGNTACDLPPTGVNSIRHDSLGLAIQPVLYPAKSTPVQAMSSQFLQENAGSICSVMGLSVATRFEVLQHGLMHSHRCFKVYLLQHGLIHSHGCFKVYLLQCGLILGPQSLQRYTGSSTDITMATDASRWTCSCVDLSMATDISGCPAPAWTHPQVTVPTTRVHTGVPACPVQQHRNSSNALAICQPRGMAIAVIKMFPGTAQLNFTPNFSTSSL
ncbi:hypothetical protein QYF61_000221 [Mycteria americana]|uniref:Uncharacterized protein n=1 Tax=Mycteria americana TaxID=33587 RepID=A0AAN7NEA9_MYCAM|nr:hypothetical protein QYF61_000221 [Mycteria americana]